MANPLYNLLNPNNGQQGNDMQAQFDSFKRTVQGDPKAMVDQLRTSGQMSEQQFNYLSMMANVLRGQLK